MIWAFVCTYGRIHSLLFSTSFYTTTTPTFLLVESRKSREMAIWCAFFPYHFFHFAHFSFISNVDWLPDSLAFASLQAPFSCFFKDVWMCVLLISPLGCHWSASFDPWPQFWTPSQYPPRIHVHVHVLVPPALYTHVSACLRLGVVSFAIRSSCLLNFSLATNMSVFGDNREKIK